MKRMLGLFAPDCPFCRIAAGREPADVVHESRNAMIIRPLNPVTPGHVLVIPLVHVEDATRDIVVAGEVMVEAAGWVYWQKMQALRDDRPSLYESVNFITSVGVPATQSVFHLHLHIVPRRDGDGLHLPWTGQQT